MQGWGWDLWGRFGLRLFLIFYPQDKCYLNSHLGSDGIQEVGGAQELGRRRPPLGGGGRAATAGGGRAATARPPPAVAARRPTLKRDSSTVLDAAHVDGLASNLLGMHKGLVIRHHPRAKKGGRRRAARGHSAQFAQSYYDRFLPPDHRWLFTSRRDGAVEAEP